MSNKNPYEIRLETLKMAKEMLDQAYHSQMDMTHQALEQWKEAGKDAKEFLSEYTPKMYQPTEVVKQAQEFYKFITENK
jgi:adenosine deaminase